MSREQWPRALVTGWFSMVHGEATAGDLLALRTVRDWLEDEEVPHDVALSPVLARGGDEAVPSAGTADTARVVLDEVDASGYTHLVFVCGPVAGWQVQDLLARFSHCVKVAVGVSVVPSTPAGFDLVLARDGLDTDRPDLSLGAAKPALPPAVAVIRSHPQEEYPDARHEEAHRLIDDTLRNMDVAVLELDTRVDPRNVVGRRTEDVEALIARADAVVSTRMHGLVLALRHGVPAVAVDAVPGGAKVSRQAAALDWPGVLAWEDLSAERLREQLVWALAAAAHDRRREPAGPRAGALAEVRSRLLEALST